MESCEGPNASVDCDFPALLAENTVSDAALVRRPSLEAVGGLDERLPQRYAAWDLWIRLVEAGRHGVIVPEVLLHSRSEDPADLPPRLDTDADAVAEAGVLRQWLLAHAGTFLAHLPEVLAAREELIGRHARDNATLEQDLARDSRVALQLADDMSVLERRVRDVLCVGRAREQAESLAREVAALRSSASWRLTAPLRALLDLIRGGRR